MITPGRPGTRQNRVPAGADGVFNFHARPIMLERYTTFAPAVPTLIRPLMFRSLSSAARRAAFAACILALAASGGWVTVARSSEITASDDFRDVAAAVARYAEEFGPERVLLVLDIDNTLLAMNQ